MKLKYLNMLILKIMLQLFENNTIELQLMTQLNLLMS